MGQAKKRGNFDDRKSQAIARDEAERARKIQEEKDWYDSLTEEEKETVRRNLEIRAENMRAVGMWMGALGGFNFRRY